MQNTFFFTRKYKYSWNSAQELEIIFSGQGSHRPWAIRLVATELLALCNLVAQVSICCPSNCLSKHSFPVFLHRPFRRRRIPLPWLWLAQGHRVQPGREGCELFWAVVWVCVSCVSSCCDTVVPGLSEKQQKALERRFHPLFWVKSSKYWYDEDLYVGSSKQHAHFLLNFLTFVSSVVPNSRSL